VYVAIVFYGSALSELICTHKSLNATDKIVGECKSCYVEQAGGVIFMIPGQPLEAKPNIGEVAQALCRSIRVSHAAQIAHCDVRRSNIVRFPSGLQLIDYGLSCKLGKSQTLHFGSKQTQSAGWKVTSLMDKGVREVNWGVSDDYEMIITFLVKMSTI